MFEEKCEIRNVLFIQTNSRYYNSLVTRVDCSVLIKLENKIIQSAAFLIDFSRWVLLVKEGEKQKNIK